MAIVAEGDDAREGVGSVSLTGGVIGHFSSSSLRDERDSDEAVLLVGVAAHGVVDACHGEGGKGAVPVWVVCADGLDEGETAFLEQFPGIPSRAARVGEAAVPVQGEMDQREVGLDEGLLSGADGREGYGSLFSVRHVSLTREEVGGGRGRSRPSV